MSVSTFTSATKGSNLCGLAALRENRRSEMPGAGVPAKTQSRKETGTENDQLPGGADYGVLAQAILNRIAAGDATAVQDCLKAYGGLVWSLARRMLRNTEDAEDVVQEVFVDVWKNAERFDPSQSSETTFVAMIARRRIIDRIRYAQRRLAPDSLEDILNEPASRVDVSLQTSVEAAEAAKALQTLRPEQQQVLQLSIVHGLSHQEISERTGMPLGTVKTHARRGILQAREVLGLGKERSAKEVSV